MKLLWLDLNSSYAHSSLALAAIHAQAAGEDGVEAAGGEVHPLDGVDDLPPGIHQDDIAVAAHDLADQGGLHPVPQLIGRLKDQAEDPVQPRLFGPEEPPAAQVLAQKHTEHGGLVRILPVQGGHLGPGLAGAGREEQLPVPLGAPHRQDHLVPSGLINFVNFSALQGGFQLLHHGGEAYGV